MAIGDTVQAGLMRVDSSPILLAGQAQAQANQAFGNALGQVAEGYFIGKEKKERAKEIEEELIRQGASPESAKAISKNPFLQKEHARKQEADQRMAIEKMRVSAQQAISGAGRTQRAALEETRIKERNEAKAELKENQQKQIGLSNFLMSGTEMNPEVLEDFNQAQPGLFALGGDQGARNRFLEYRRDTAPKVGKLGGELESSEFASKAMEAGVDPVLAGNYFMKLQAREDESLQNAPKPMTPEQLLDYQIKLNKERRDQAKEEREASEFEEENKPMPPVDPVYKEAAINAIDSAIEKSKGFFATGITGQALQRFAGTDARDLAQAISTVEAAVGFDRLQEMRDSSKTGGALGAINTKELELLSNSLGSLDPLQKPETLRKNLESIKEKYVKILKSVEAEKYAFENNITFKTPKEAMDFVNNFNASSPQQSANTIDPSAPASQATLDALEKARQLRNNRIMMQQTLDNPNIPNYGPQ
jgi:hypothetical protein